MDNIYTIEDWMNRIGEAIEEGDHEMLNECIRCSIDWLQPEDERMAQLFLVESVKELMLDTHAA